MASLFLFKRRMQIREVNMDTDVWQTRCNAKEEIMKLEPKIDLLHDLLGFGRFAGVTQTSDGFFLAREHGDIGFNQFLGKPSDNARGRSKELFNKLSKCSQGFVLATLKGKHINLKDVGIE